MILLSLEKIPSTSPRLYKDSRKSKIIMNIQANNQHAKFETTPLTQTDGQCNIWLASELTQYSVMLISDLYDFMTVLYSKSTLLHSLPLDLRLQYRHKSTTVIVKRFTE